MPIFAQSSKEIEGVYDFVSQEITITKSGNITKTPAEKHILASPRWTGLWQINNGYFSSFLMKAERDTSSSCEKRLSEFEAFAGTYGVDGDEITFKQNYSLDPFFKGRPVIMSYKIENNILTLSKHIYPTIEDMKEGTMIITLKRR